MKESNLDEHISSGCEDELTGRLFVRGGLLGFVRTNNPTSARHGDDLGYIRATPPRRLVFWDGAPSLYKCIRAMS